MNILENGQITTVFQTIISLKDGSKFGHEALSRGPKMSAFENPAQLFDVAKIYGKLWELEFLCRIKAIESASRTVNDQYLFLNVDPAVINDEKFKKGFTKEFLLTHEINPDSVVFEITEKSSISELDNFRKIIENYKDQGYKIAIDDAGDGYSGLKLITDIRPHFIKLDMNLVRDIDKDGLKYALIKTFYEFCLVTDIKLIAEGIETEEELAALIDIGIHYGQGFFIQRPSENPENIRPSLIEFIKKKNYKKSMMYCSRPATLNVGEITRNTLVLKQNDTGAKVLECFNSNPGLQGIPIINDKKLVGTIMKDKFYAKLGTQYGFALFLNRPISILMDKRPLIVDFHTTIDIVSKIAMTRTNDSLYDYIVITKDDNYYGIVTVKDLLQKTIELEVSYAKHLNPLSGLPGNMLIEKKLNELICNDFPFTVLYIDLDNFKAYNDIYGFENGDRVLQFTGRIITECIPEEILKNCFIGHVGGDDFIIAIDGFDNIKIIENIINAFDKGVREFYNLEDFQNGFVYSKNRHGEIEKYGILSVSIAGVTNRESSFKDIYQLSETAVKIKKKCKECWKSCFILE